METIEEFRALIDGTMKECFTCKKVKNVEDFYMRDYGNVCIVCRKVVAARNRLTRCGITEEELAERLQKQGNKCLICSVEFKVYITKKGHKRVSYHIDHYHGCCPGRYSCGKCIRGLLCGPCNVGLGHHERLMAYKEALDGYLGN